MKSLNSPKVIGEYANGPVSKGPLIFLFTIASVFNIMLPISAVKYHVEFRMGD